MSWLEILLCPLGMAAMGGIAWAATRLPGKPAERLARVANHATCMPMGNKGQPAEIKETTPGAGIHDEARARV